MDSNDGGGRLQKQKKIRCYLATLVAQSEGKSLITSILTSRKEAICHPDIRAIT